ncbi:ankyrin repeat-containing domain protein [Neocallimastix sp. 'constans']
MHYLWLTRWPAKPFPFGSAGSSPAGDEEFFKTLLNFSLLPSYPKTLIHKEGHLNEQLLKSSQGLAEYLANTIPIISSSLELLFERFSKNTFITKSAYVVTGKGIVQLVVLTVPNTEPIINNSIFDDLSCGSEESLVDTTLSISKMLLLCFIILDLTGDHKYAKMEKKNIIKYLIKHGADVNKENKNEETPLYCACQEGNEKIVKYLIECGADIKMIDDLDDINEESYIGNNLLFHACESGNENIVKYLVKHGVDVKKNKSGNENRVKYIVEFGVDITIEDNRN